MSRGWSALVLFAVLTLAFAIAHRLFHRPLQESLPDYPFYTKYDFDREGGHLVPNLDLMVQGERAGHGVHFVTNSKGFRSEREFAYDPPAGTYRILFLGDSFVDGMRTDQHRTIGYTLERLLNDASSRPLPKQAGAVEVLIAGNNNPAVSWYYYQEHGSRYHPDLVILGVTLGNDLTSHGYGSCVFPVVTERGTRLRLQRDGHPWGMERPDLLLPAAAFRPASPLRDALLDRGLQLRSFLASHFYMFRNSIPPNIWPVPNYRRHVFAGVSGCPLGLYYQPLMPEFEKMFLDFEDVLLNMARHVRSDKSRFIAVLFPGREQAQRGDFELLARFYGLDENRFDLAYPNRRIDAFCHAKGIECLDLLDTLTQAATSAGESLYRGRGDMHYNEEGQEIVARALARYVLKAE